MSERGDRASASSALPRIAHWTGIVLAVLWWCGVFYATGFFATLTSAVLALYVLGLLVAYVLGSIAVRGLGAIVAFLR